MTPPVAARPACSTVADLPRFGRGIVTELVTDPGTAERLSALGLCVGAAFKVLRAGACAVVQVGESRIGLGPDLSRALRVVAC
jgi:Fe2+ transport system protein FeoA